MQDLKNIIMKNGASIVRFADLRDIESEITKDLQYGIAIGVALNPETIINIKDGPTKEYYEENVRVDKFLNEIAEKTSNYLISKGYKATYLYSTKRKKDLNNNLSTNLPHKTIATRSGLGWIGKCALLVTKEFGSAIRIIGVETNAELPVDKPITKSKCGNCKICVEKCPAKAPLGVNWKPGLNRADFYDAFACKKKTAELSDKIGVDEKICGICIRFCPWTIKYLNKELGKRREN